jgi:hypothetical protein
VDFDRPAASMNEELINSFIMAVTNANTFMVRIDLSTGSP